MPMESSEATETMDAETLLAVTEALTEVTNEAAAAIMDEASSTGRQAGKQQRLRPMPSKAVLSDPNGPMKQVRMVLLCYRTVQIL
jgi:hypothetical protein